MSLNRIAKLAVLTFIVATWVVVIMALVHSRAGLAGP